MEGDDNKEEDTSLSLFLIILHMSSMYLAPSHNRRNVFFTCRNASILKVDDDDDDDGLWRRDCIT